jgi:glutamine amidotransferase
MLAIVDYGMGNIGSLVNMFKRIGVATTVTAAPGEIARASKLLLPGVGAFDAAMTRIEQGGLLDVLQQKAMVERVPVLGVCLGMQLLTRGSEEGSRPGLGWIPGLARRFRSDPQAPLKVPHMGWNEVSRAASSPLTADLLPDSRFYFVHSYYVRVEDERHSILKTRYGVEFDAAVQRDNVFGAQFHPEKSHKFGLRLLESFARL